MPGWIVLDQPLHAVQVSIQLRGEGRLRGRLPHSRLRERLADRVGARSVRGLLSSQCLGQRLATRTDQLECACVLRVPPFDDALGNLASDVGIGCPHLQRVCSEACSEVTL